MSLLYVKILPVLVVNSPVNQTMAIFELEILSQFM